MDPDACATRYFRAMADHDHAEALDAMSDLTCWARGGGFMTPYSKLALRHAADLEPPTVELHAGSVLTLRSLRCDS